VVVDNNNSIKAIEFSDKKIPTINSSSGISLSVVSDKSCYDNYGPVYLRLGTKNVSSDSVSMIIDTTNVFDVYELTLLTPGDNLDFRKPAAKDKSDVQKVEYTLYGKKLLSEKSKTPKPTVTIKPNVEAAESVIVLNRIFDMSTDGIYGLLVTRKIIDAAGKEQTISSEPFPIRVGKRLTQDEIDERVQQRRLDGYDPDYPTWQSRDGLFKVIAKFISVGKDIVTLEKPDGKKTTFNISDLTPNNQNYIKEQTQKKPID
jgi:septum formation topological specificity factor MinE